MLRIKESVVLEANIRLALFSSFMSDLHDGTSVHSKQFADNSEMEGVVNTSITFGTLIHQSTCGRHIVEGG